MTNLEKMENALNGVREDYAKAKSGNKSACTRVRKVMQDIKKMAQDTRAEMLGK